MWYKWSAKTVDDALEDLSQKGVDPTVIDHVRSQPQDQLGFYLSTLRKNPMYTVDQLQSIQPTQKKQAAGPTPQEAQIAYALPGGMQPWVLVQLRKLRTTREPNSVGEFSYRGYEDLRPEHAIQIIKGQFEQLKDWWSASERENPNFQISNFSFAQAIGLSDEWHKMMAGQGEGQFYTPFNRDEEGNINDERIVHKFDDGWFVTLVNNANDLKVEGNKLNHCVGGYHWKVNDGSVRIYSIRDTKNHPQATIETDGDGKLIEQIKGNSNGLPSDKAMNKASEWLNSIGAKWNKESDTGSYNEVYWGDGTPEDINRAVHEEVFGSYAEDEEEDLDEHYGIPYNNSTVEEKEERKLSEFDITDVFDTVLEKIEGGYPGQTRNKKWNKHFFEDYHMELNDSAKTMAAGAVAADILRMDEKINTLWEEANFQARVNIAKQRGAVADPFHGNANIVNVLPDDPDVIQETEALIKGTQRNNQVWWRNFCQVPSFQFKYDEICEERMDEKKDPLWNPHENANENYKTGFAANILNEIANHITPEYTQLFQTLTGADKVPVQTFSSLKPNYKQMALMQHKNEIHPNIPVWDSKPNTWTLGKDPQTGATYPGNDPNFDGEWKYSKSLWYQRLA